MHTFREILDEKTDDGVQAKFTGLLFLGDDCPLDTNTEVNFETVISWRDKDVFFEELLALINKFKI